MNKFFWLILLILWILLGLWFCNKYICGISAAAPAAAAAAAVVPAKDKCAGPWSINDNKNFNSRSNGYVNFLRSKFSHLDNNRAVTNSITKTADYLKKNSNRSLVITGYYDENENNGSILSNLGMARANDVKGWLTSLGVPGKQLDIKGQLTRDNCFKNDTLTRGVAFNFGAISNDNSRIADIKSRLVGKPLTVYFQTNSDNINLNAQQRTDVADIIYYLDNVGTSKLDISGHTDNVGNRAYNVNLSQNRADFVMKYFSKNGGIAQNKMTVKGHGPDKPVAPNNTKDGKAKNRRVEATLR